VEKQKERDKLDLEEEAEGTGEERLLADTPHRAG
jgi:hypothetical protein